MNIGISVFGLFITHLYRSIILRRNWQQLPLEKLLNKVVLSIFALTALFAMWYYLLLFILYRELGQQLNLNKILSSLVSICILFVLWNTFYFMWSYIENSRKNLIAKLKMESELKDMEIRTLRANLQPHFIFNALNSIRALIDENPTLAREAVTRMSNILRNSISKQQTTDSLQNELQLVEDYLLLEKIRFEERLQYVIQIAPETFEISIPTMMLQTLVENAIKHGISKLEAGGFIEISSKLVGNQLHLIVKNSGQLDAADRHADSLGFGLKATESRLLYMYGSEAQFILENQKNAVCATIILPINPSIP